MKSISCDQDLKEIFDRIVCINLDRRPDRWADFRERLAAIDWPFREVERYRAIDGDRVTSPQWIDCGYGAWGCLRSHIRILEDALMDGVSSLFILEDDATFLDDFAVRARQFFRIVPQDWDGLLLGGQHLVRPEYVCDGVVRVLQGNRTHAHAYYGEYIRATYRHLCDFVEHSETPQFHVDHRLGTLHLRGDFDIYAPNPWLIGQAGGCSDISGNKEDGRHWQESIKFDDREPITSDKSVDECAAPIPIVVLLGLYRSGCGAVACALDKLGGYLGEVDLPFYEETYLRELCRNFFYEPTLVETVPSQSRIRLLKRWAIRMRRAACSQKKHFIIAKHPLLAMLGSDLREAWGPKIKYVAVERDICEAALSLQKMDWPTFRHMEHFAQEKLLARLDSYLIGVKHLNIDFARLRQSPENSIQALADLVGMSHDKEKINQAIQAIELRAEPADLPSDPINTAG